MVPYLAGSTRGPTMRTTKTLQKVLACAGFIELSRTAFLTRLPEASTLDTWVLEHLETLFQNATSDPPLDLQLRQEKTLFFLHLLGLDVTGHSHRPHSRVRASRLLLPSQLPKLTLPLRELGIHGKHQGR